MAKLKRRGRIWYAWICGELRSTGCTDKPAAQLRAAQLERAAVDPHYKAAHETTFGVAATRFIESVSVKVDQGKRSPRTLEFYEYKCAHLVRVLGDETLLGHITSTSVDDYLSQRHGEGSHPSTMSKEIVALSQILKLAKRRGEYHHDLDAVLPHGLGDGYKPREQFLTPVELGKLTAVQSPQHAAATLFIVATSARKREMEQARREDVDTEQAMVRLRGTKTAGAKRTIPIADPLLPLLVRSMELAVPIEDGRLFGEWGNAVRDLAAACIRAGVPRVTPNDLRRTTSSWLYGSGVELGFIAPIMGHADTRMLERVYARIKPENLRRVINSRILDQTAQLGQNADHEHRANTEQGDE